MKPGYPDLQATLDNPLPGPESLFPDPLGMSHDEPAGTQPVRATAALASSSSSDPLRVDSRGFRVDSRATAFFQPRRNVAVRGGAR